LQNEKDCSGVDESHAAVETFYSQRNDKMEENVNVIRNKLYTEKEISDSKEMGRKLISINKALAPYRTVIGTIMQSAFDASFLPMEESDEAISEILQKLAIFESERNNDFSDNTKMCQNAYVMARAYRYNWIEQGNDSKPRIRSKVLNPFAVYFDPDSADVIARQDAEFVDVVHWLSYNELIEAFPDAEGKIDATSKEDRNLTDYYETYDKSANRLHETMDEINGKFKVIERYYRVRAQGQEQLYLAVWAPNRLTDNSFLYNGPYHVQPIDADTKKAMFPIVELVTDNIMGESDGFVEFLKDPVKIISLLFTQLLEAAKHSGTGYEVDRSKYANDEEADRAMKYGAFANQRYEMKENQAGNGMRPVQALQTPQPNINALANATQFIDEISSAPKALQGVSESASTPASLNAQRIEQASTQLAMFLGFYKQYLKQTLKLRYAYWRESYSQEMTFRITAPEGGQEFVTMNQLVPQMGYNNLPTGEVQKLNDISAAEFDVVISDSYRSPTYAMKMTGIINDLLQNPAIAQNPNIAPLLVDELFRLSDAPQELKQKFKQQMEMQAMQQQAMMQTQQPQTPPMAGVA